MASEGSPSIRNKTGQQRKRLSVVGGDALIEGLAKASIEDEELAEEGSRGVGTAVVSYEGQSKKGYAPYNPQKANQDSMIMTEDPNTGSLLLAVMDGHGEFGHNISQYFKQQWPPLLFGHPEFGKHEGVPIALTESINAAETRMHREMGPKDDFSGTTFVGVVIRGDDMWIANIGDSRITAAFRKEGGGYTARALSRDHKPDTPGEKERILATGGRVFAVQYDDGIEGPQRVWLRDMDLPGLAMARSLGDVIAHTAGVSSEPEITHETINREEMAFFVIASDGLWEFMSDQDVIDQAAAKCVNTPLAKVVDGLVATARELWLKEEEVIDDTTVVLGCIEGFPESA